jgi:phage recombination protein Bet
MSTALAIRRNGGLTRQDPKKLRLFTQTVGKELVGTEIDEAIEWCEIYGANPFVRDIYFFVFDAKDAEKRRVVPVLGIGLYRKIAARTGNYRPDDKPPRFAYDDSAKNLANPTGMLWCEVSVYRHSHGEWFPVTVKLKWEERAPIKAGGFRWVDTGEVWPDSGKPKRKKVADDSVASLDEKKTNWHTMPETMMAKCCEADAIRKGWPNETAGSYVAEEMDAARTIDLTATEVLAEDEKAAKLGMIGGSEALIVDWTDGKPLDRVPLAVFWDRSLAWMSDKDRSETEIRIWIDRNKLARAEAKAKAGSHYLDWWKAVEKRINALAAAESQQAAGSSWPTPDTATRTSPCGPASPGS